MLIDGFAVSGYRSFGKELQKLYPLGKINLIIGKNNCGKSNVLRLLVNHLGDYIKILNSHGGDLTHYSEIDKHIGDKERPIIIGLAMDLNTEKVRRKLEESSNEAKRLLAQLFDSDYIKNNNNILWLLFDQPSRKGDLSLYAPYIDEIKENELLSPNTWGQLSSALISSTSNLERNIESVLYLLFRSLYRYPEIYFVPAIRNINSAQTKTIDLSGNGIIDKLAKLQNPDHDEQNLKKDFEKVNHFLRSVLGNEDAKIEIPYARDKIVVHMDGKSLPLNSLGTGVHEVIILASAATLINDSIICIEEPEIHLHPVLQKKLLNYFFDNTSNQYFIATHSPHLLDVQSTQIFHITHDGKSSVVSHVTTNDKLFNICSDLGYRPSDLLQANCIIWVEGPSDRIFINNWLKSLDDSLIEGIHYSIMFYGGKLLSHLSADDGQVDDFISLTSINRNSIIVIDSDKDKEDCEINETKKRVVDEFEKSGKIAWVTKGREIENYIDPDIYEKSILKIHPSAEKLVSKTIYSNLPKYIQKKTHDVSYASKIKAAKEVSQYESDFSILDLKEKIESIYTFIKKSNGIET